MDADQRKDFDEYVYGEKMTNEDLPEEIKEAFPSLMDTPIPDWWAKAGDDLNSQVM